MAVPSFTLPEDEILKEFMELLMKAKLLDTSQDEKKSLYKKCLGSSAYTLETIQSSLCDRRPYLITYYRKIRLVFCSKHVRIFLDYLNHPIHHEDPDGEVEVEPGILAQMMDNLDDIDNNSD